MRHKVTLLFSLYFCQGLPGGFLAVVLPVIFREQGISLTAIGFTSLLSAPWVLKILWAPLVDKYSWPRFGRRKSWIIPSQAAMMLICLLFMFVTPDKNLMLMGFLFLCLNFFAATQDIGVDGFAVDILSRDEMGPGNAAQISGFKMGNLFGGGVLLALSGYLGWHGDFAIMAGCIFLAMVLLLVSDERQLSRVGPAEKKSSQHVLLELWRTVRQQGFLFWFFLVFAKFGETFGGAMVKPMLVDHGLSREMIGLLDGLFGSIATIIGAILGGMICRRYGWAKALAVFSVFQGIALIALGITSTGTNVVAILAVINVLENFAGGGVGVSIFALAMSLCRSEVGASQFTVSQVVYMCGAFLAHPLAGIVGDFTGYLPLMASGGLMACLLAGLALLLAPRFTTPQ
ncbi:MFS transporter [candidate division CSSED10-310 bacterium]|uniref:MFS transporter n=1 Tax=candidate division CSSED10-310 bacterium TaxID=2855610 RepID=A0ABV6YXJ3_UNCC1